MTSPFILSENDQSVACITLNRPEVLNSFNRRMATELREALNDAARDSAVRAVLLTGSGRAFCAEQDLSEASTMLSGAASEIESEARLDLGDIVRDSYNPIIHAIREMEKPVVCATERRTRWGWGKSRSGLRHRARLE